MQASKSEDAGSWDVLNRASAPLAVGLHARSTSSSIHPTRLISALKRSAYFWVDVARRHRALQATCPPLVTPMPLMAADAYQMDKKYFGHWSHSIDVWIDKARISGRRSPLRFRQRHPV
jgi:hypothetical protein